MQNTISKYIWSNKKWVFVICHRTTAHVRRSQALNYDTWISTLKVFSSALLQFWILNQHAFTYLFHTVKFLISVPLLKKKNMSKVHKYFEIFIIELFLHQHSTQFSPCLVSTRPHFVFRKVHFHSVQYQTI